MAGKQDNGRGSGWNDPPASRYSSTTRGSLPRKRAPYPCQVNCTPPANSELLNPTAPLPSSPLASSDTVSPCVKLFPPLLGTDPASYTAPLIIPTLSTSNTAPSIATNPVTAASIAVITSLPDAELDVPEFEDDEQLFHYVVTRLHRALNDCQYTADPHAAEEMQKKVNVFSDMWKNGKISYPVKSAMARLATAIHRRRCDTAHDILTSLMMDHVSEVSRWLVGMKRLVQEVRNVDAPLSPSSVCHNSSKPLLLCDIQPSVPANCPSLVATSSESTGAPAMVLDGSCSTVADVVSPTDASASAAVRSSSDLIDSQHALTPAGSCEFTSHVSSEDTETMNDASDAVLSSTDEHHMMSVADMQVTPVDNDHMLTSADTVTVDS